MTWVTIDQDKCNSCGLCAKVCVRCFSNQDGVIRVEANELNCNLCGHCVSLCSTEAITHSKMDMNNFLALDDPVRYDPDEFIRFVRQRRSCRAYKNKEVPREHLEKLIDMCRYTPTGSNLQKVQIKVITNKEKIKKLSDLTVDFFLGMINQLDDQIKKLTSQNSQIPQELQNQYTFLNRYRILGTARDGGRDPIHYQAPVLILFHSPPSPSTPKDDCIIAAQTMVLAAMTVGLGTCYIGLLRIAAENYPPVSEALDLPAGNTLHSTLILGYPQLKFFKAVDRKPMTVQWEE
jgi:nitroreductase/NAD-dependent dihydropyrimidine dehydrogenase PreA subunit